jgi:hypothetical protein
VQYCLAQPKTLLPRIVGIGNIGETQYLVMANVFGTEAPHWVFDLKVPSKMLMCWLLQWNLSDGKL